MIVKCLDISTTHVTKKDVILLWWSTDEEREQYSTLPVVAAYETGLFCCVPDPDSFSDLDILDAGVSESFIKVLTYARAVGCSLIHLSGSGHIMNTPLLKNHHWEMEDNNLWDLSTDDIQDINKVVSKL